MAEKSEVVIMMLPNSPHVKQAVLGENGVAEGARKGTIVVDINSIDPTATKEIHGKLTEKGIEMLDAPVSGENRRPLTEHFPLWWGFTGII